MYTFDTLTDRRNTGALKWNVPENELPMWVADMDFETAPEIVEALKKRAEHGIFGYCEVGQDWYQAYQNWWQIRHDFFMEKEWLLFVTGIVPAISSIVRKCTDVGEKVLLLTPVYNIFYNSIYNNGRVIEECPLTYADGKYSIPWEAFEEKLSDPQVSLLLFCNPHNPVGKIWDKETLFKVGELCQKHHVLVLSDEIHCDLTLPGKNYIPFASVSETCKNNSITCIAPTKAFNLAGIQTAAICVPNPVLRHKVWRGINTDEVAEPNVFAAIAPVAAFCYGGDWLAACRAYLAQNRAYTAEVLKEALDGKVKLIEADATYLAWIDVSQITADADLLCEHLRKTTGLYVCAGSEYGAGSKGFLRMNLACPKERLKDGLSRFVEGCLTF